MKPRTVIGGLALVVAVGAASGCSDRAAGSIPAAATTPRLVDQIPDSIGGPATVTTTATLSPTVTSATTPTRPSLSVSGPWVSITSGDYPRDDAGWAYGPMPAPGITAYQRDSNGELDGCTISFPVIDSQGTVAFLSAGHCDQRTGERLSMITTPDGSGSIELGDYQQSVDDQTVLARETPIPGAAARDYTVLTMGDQLYRGYRTEIARGVRLRGVMNTDTVRALPKGTMLCKNGAHTGVTCGPLVSADARTATFAVRAIKGDSGAPIFVVNSAGEALGVGILSGFDAAGNTVVAYLSPALSQLGLRAVLSE